MTWKCFPDSGKCRRSLPSARNVSALHESVWCQQLNLQSKHMQPFVNETLTLGPWNGADCKMNSTRRISAHLLPYSIKVVPTLLLDMWDRKMALFHAQCLQEFPKVPHHDPGSCPLGSRQGQCQFHWVSGSSPTGWAFAGWHSDSIQRAQGGIQILWLSNCYSVAFTGFVFDFNSSATIWLHWKITISNYTHTCKLMHHNFTKINQW